MSIKKIWNHHLVKKSSWLTKTSIGFPLKPASSTKTQPIETQPSFKSHEANLASMYHMNLQDEVGLAFSSWWFQRHLQNISQIGLFPQVGMKIKLFETTT